MLPGIVPSAQAVKCSRGISFLSKNLHFFRTIDDYMKWCVAFRLTPTLDRRLFNDSVQPLYNLLLGLMTSPPRWLECTMQTEAMIALAVSSLYIKLRSSTAAEVRQQVSCIRNHNLCIRLTAWHFAGHAISSRNDRGNPSAFASGHMDGWTNSS